jgi:hypothetical protein
MNKIKAYDEKAMRKSTKIAAMIAGVALIVLGIFTSAKYSIPVGVVLLLATVMEKDIYITEEGIEVVYNLFAFKYADKWSFNSITDIHKEEVSDNKFYVLHFMKDVMSRRVVFLIEDVDEVIRLALEKNGNIHLADVNDD